MEIIFNNQNVSAAENSSLKAFLEEHGYTAGIFSVAINQQFIQRAQYEQTILNAMDKIDIIKPMQGG